MASNNVTVRRSALAAPVLLLAYGLLRLIDGLDGIHGPGLAWTLGHLAFAAAMVLFGVLAVAVRPLIPARPGTVAAVAVIAGVACFLWVIAGDLWAGLGVAMPLPGPLTIAGPLLFALGVLALLGLLVAAGHVPVWSPLLFGAGLVTIIIAIDFLPPAALILLAALSPLARPASEQVEPTYPHVPTDLHLPTSPRLPAAGGVLSGRLPADAGTASAGPDLPGSRGESAGARPVAGQGASAGPPATARTGGFR